MMWTEILLPMLHHGYTAKGARPKVGRYLGRPGIATGSPPLPHQHISIRRRFPTQGSTGALRLAPEGGVEASYMRIQQLLSGTAVVNGSLATEARLAATASPLRRPFLVLLRVTEARIAAAVVPH